MSILDFDLLGGNKHYNLGHHIHLADHDVLKALHCLKEWSDEDAAAICLANGALLN